MKITKIVACIVLLSFLAVSSSACRSEEGNIPYVNVGININNVMMADIDPIAAAALMGNDKEIYRLFDNAASFAEFAKEIDDITLSDTYNQSYFDNGDVIFLGLLTTTDVGYSVSSINITGDVLTVTLGMMKAGFDDADKTYIGIFIETDKIYVQGINKVIVDVV